MKENAIDLVVAKQAQDGLDALYSKLQLTHAEIVKISKLQIDFNGGKSPKAVPEINNQIDAFKKLQEQYKIQSKLIEGLHAQIVRLSAQKQKVSTQTVEEAVNQGILNRQARQAATINSTLAGAYAKLSAEQAKSATAVQNIIARGRTASQTQKQYNQELQRAQSQFDKLNQKVLLADRAVGKFNRNVGNYPKVVSGFGNLLGAFGIVGGVTLIAALAKDIFNTTRELQALDLALTQVIGSQEKAAETQAFLSKTAEDYGINIQTLTKSYTGFYAAAKNALNDGKFSAQQINDIFGSVSKAAGAMGLSVEQQQGAFLALSQMISKGTVQAEELRGQLSERLPGAFGILAKSMGVTEQQLNNMLKDGKVLAAEVLPAFAKELEKAYGVENITRIQTLNAETTRLKNAWTEFIRTLNEGDGVFSKALADTISGLAVVIKGLDYLITSSASKRENELKMIRQNGYDSVIEHNKKLDKAGKEELKNSTDYLIEKAAQHQEEVALIRETNKELEKEARNKGYWGGFMPTATINRIEEGNKKIKELNLVLSSYYGQIKAGQELLSGQTGVKDDTSKRTVAFLEGLIKGENELLKLTTKRGEATPIQERIKGYEKEIELILGGNKAKEKQLKKLADFYSSEYELVKLKSEAKSEIYRKEYENEEKSYQQRINSLEKFTKIELELADKANAERLRLLKLERDTEIAEIKRAMENQSITSENGNSLIRSLNRKFKADELVALQQYSDSYLSITERTSKDAIDIIRKQNETIASTEKIYRDEQSALFKKTSDNEKLSTTIRQEAFRAYISLKRKELDIEKQVALAKAGNNEAELANVKARFEVAERLLNQEYETESPFVKSLEAANAELEKIKETATSGIFQGAGLGSLQDLFDGTFDSIMDGFDKIEDRDERYLKKFQYTFAKVADIAKETFDFINQLSQQNYQAEYDRLEKQYQVNVLFAGDSVSAKEEVERQYEERRRKIQLQQAQAEKESAIFKGVINTASAIVAALPNLALSAIVGVLGAAQVAMIASQPIPQFKDGGIHDGGLMMVNDGDGDYKETVVTPDGKVIKPTGKNVIMSAPKGTQIFNSKQQGQLNKMLEGLGINPVGRDFSAHLSTTQFNGATANEIDDIMGKHLGSRPEIHMGFNEKGFYKYNLKNGQKIKSSNKRLFGKGD